MSVPAIPRLAAVLVLSCLIPVPSAAHARGVAGVAGSVDAAPAAVWEAVRCTAESQEPQQSHRMPKVIGWLYRWVRGFDVERSATPAPQLYLRSPLLAGFNETVNCPVPVVEPRATTCVAVTASDGREHLATYLVTLPHQGARTPADLQAMLRKRLSEGERVPLRTLAGGRIELDPKTALEIEVKACGSEIG